MAQPSRILRLHYPQLVKPTAPISPGYPRRAFGFSFMIRFKSSRISSLDLLVWKDKAGVSKLAASETNIATLAHQLEWCSQVIKFVNLVNLCEIPSEWARGIEVLWTTSLNHFQGISRKPPWQSSPPATASSPLVEYPWRSMAESSTAEARWVSWVGGTYCDLPLAAATPISSPPSRGGCGWLCQFRCYQAWPAGSKILTVAVSRL